MAAIMVAVVKRFWDVFTKIQQAVESLKKEKKWLSLFFFFSIAGPYRLAARTHTNTHTNKASHFFFWVSGTDMDRRDGGEGPNYFFFLIPGRPTHTESEPLRFGMNFMVGEES
jgi:hypothetical protein